MPDVLSHPRFHDEEAAYQWVEAHLWPHGPECPRCKVTGERVTKLKGASTRVGTYKCKDCRKPFTVKIGTIFEDSHIAMRLWLQAIALICASKKGISSNQLHRTLGITLKSAWFMSHRIREAMRTGGLAPIGGPGTSGIVEADETYFGKIEERATTRTSGQPFKNRGNKGPANKRAVLSLLERRGEVRSFHIARADKETVTQIVNQNVSTEARLMTDESRLYRGVQVVSHERVKHAAKEYARGDVTTNTVESYFSVFKRGMKGTYQHCSEKHLHRYLAEFDFRYNARVGIGVDDEQRAVKALVGVKGKRLKYRTADRA
jgi:transposase-like protein